MASFEVQFNKADSRVLLQTTNDVLYINFKQPTAENTFRIYSISWGYTPLSAAAAAILITGKLQIQLGEIAPIGAYSPNSVDLGKDVAYFECANTFGRFVTVFEEPLEIECSRMFSIVVTALNNLTAPGVDVFSSAYLFVQGEVVRKPDQSIGGLITR